MEFFKIFSKTQHPQNTEITALELEKQRKESIDYKARKRENIDHYIKKEIESKQKQKKQKFEDPIFRELDHYDLPLSELVSTENITKYKEKSDKVTKYDEKTANLIESELNLQGHTQNENVSYNENCLNIIRISKLYFWRCKSY